MSICNIEISRGRFRKRVLLKTKLQRVREFPNHAAAYQYIRNHSLKVDSNPIIRDVRRTV